MVVQHPVVGCARILLIFDRWLSAASGVQFQFGKSSLALLCHIKRKHKINFDVVGLWKNVHDIVYYTDPQNRRNE